MLISGSLVNSALAPAPTNINGIDFMVLTNAIFNELYVSTRYDDFGSEIPAWDYDTIMHAKFNGNLHAGNVDYYPEEVEFMRIKRRIKGTYEWVNLFEIDIEKAEDFKFERFDKYARGNTTYEYAMVPVIRQIEGGKDKEGNINICEVKSEFNDVFISEKDVSFHSQVEVTWNTAKNHPTLVVAPINRKYPYVFGNGNANYYSGSLSAVWVELDKLCELTNDMSWDDAYGMVWQNGWEYRNRLMGFLCNGKAKILKMPDGRMWMVAITETPTESVSLHNNTPTTTFQWVEIADCESGADLYDNDFITADSNAK